MRYKIKHPTKAIECEIDLPASKSLSNRLLIIQALSEDVFKINNLSKSDDTKILSKSLKSIDTKILSKSLKSTKIDVGAAGSTFRFLTSYLSILEGKEFILTGSDRLKKRPIKQLVNSLRSLGADIQYLEEEGYAPLKIIGKSLIGGVLDVSADISSQFISSLLLIAPTLKQGLTINIVNELVSKPYIDMTLLLMKEFGVDSMVDECQIYVPHQRYIGKDYLVESDWSAASFWFEICSLSKTSKIRLNGLYSDSLQGDLEVINLFSSLSVNAKFEEDSLLISKDNPIGELSVYNVLNTPDLYLPLRCTLFGHGFEDHLITGLKTLQYKESNRVLSLNMEIDKFRSGNQIFNINTHQDHRVAMSIAPLSLIYDEILINDSEVVSKSYPNYWKDLVKAGFIIS